MSGAPLHARRTALRARRGLATFEEGLPGGEVDRHTFRFVFGETEGLVGIYPVSATQVFYFCAFPASEARPAPVARAFGQPAACRSARSIARAAAGASRRVTFRRPSV